MQLSRSIRSAANAAFRERSSGIALVSFEACAIHAAENLIQDVQTVGCIRLWKPAPDDPTKMPSDRQPGLAGIYLLTPLVDSGVATGWRCRPTC